MSGGGAAAASFLFRSAVPILSSEVPLAYSYLGTLLLLSAIWGASYLFIKIGVSEIPPMTFSGLRVLVGALVLGGILALRREKMPTERGLWARFAVMGVVNALLPFGLIGWGAQFLPSGLAAILAAAMPLFTIILAVLWNGETLTWKSVVGLFIGFGGVLVLTVPQLRGGVQFSLWGELAVIGGTLSYAVGAVYARRNLRGVSPVLASFGQVSMGTLFFIPFALAEQPWGLRPSAAAIAALLCLGVLGTGLAYILYYRLIHYSGATAASLVTYITPPFSIVWGAIILGERLGWLAFLSLAMILAGLALVNDLYAVWRQHRATAATLRQ
jgi:drug/metabolite transporter (DMT)-like permease